MILASVRPVVSIFTENRGDFDTSICFSEDMQCKIVFGHLLMTSLAFGFDANEKGMNSEQVSLVLSKKVVPCQR